MKFYDIECLCDMFTVVVYDNQPHNNDPRVRVFIQAQDTPYARTGNASGIPTEQSCDTGWVGDPRQPFYEDEAKTPEGFTYFSHNMLNLSKSQVAQLYRSIMETNPEISTPHDIRVYDLATVTGMRALLDELGLVIPISSSDPITSVATDSDFDQDVEKFYQHMRVGYNSRNYDLTMLSLWAQSAINRLLALSTLPPRDHVHPTQGRGVCGYSNTATHAALQCRLNPTHTSASHPHKDSIAHTWLCHNPILLRAHNDRLFSSDFINSMAGYVYQVDRESADMIFATGDMIINNQCLAKNIYRTMVDSGIHVDAARLNEHMSRVALKRLMAMLGHDIVESDKLDSGSDVMRSFSDVCDVIAYNVSDAVKLEKLMNHPIYTSTLELKHNLLLDYPHIRLEGDRRARALDLPAAQLSSTNRRVTSDSTSAQIVAQILSPCGSLSDSPTVSLVYPPLVGHPSAPTGNVLDYVTARMTSYTTAPLPLQAMEHIRAFYQRIDNHDCNTLSQDNDQSLMDRLKDTRFLNIPYFTTDGQPSDCYVTFSTGGIHGAQYNKALYDQDVAAYEDFMSALTQVQQRYGYNPLALLEEPLPSKRTHPQQYEQAKANKDETKRRFVKSSATASKLRKALAQKQQSNPNFDPTDPQQCQAFPAFAQAWKSMKKPQLFDHQPWDDRHRDIGYPLHTGALNKRYRFTSCGLTRHNDFESYYPRLLHNLQAFDNPTLGHDPYSEIFSQKQSLGKMMKDKDRYSDAERQKFAIQRNGTKLVLNSASGAADTKYANAIAMPNRIISMRIIGQLFTWWIAQAQTFHGGSVVSTNTDGIYVIIDDATGDRVLEQESKPIHITIEPEPVALISKDSNNRLELNPDTESIIAASGGGLRFFKGPSPEGSLAHPAFIDALLARYLTSMSRTATRPDALSQPCDTNYIHTVLSTWIQHVVNSDDPHMIASALLMAQTVVSTSTSARAYVCSSPHPIPEPSESLSSDEYPQLSPCQHYNRVFPVRQDTANAVYMCHVAARKVPTTTQRSRAAKHLKPVRIPYCQPVLEANHDTVAEHDDTIDLTTKRIPGIDYTQPVIIVNESIITMSHQDMPRAKALLLSLDIDFYVATTARVFDENWRNNA